MFDAECSCSSFKYLISTNPSYEQLLKSISGFEKEVILRSDFRIAVSNALVNLWKDKYAYSKKDHVVIPCTLNSDFENVKISNDGINEKRKQREHARKHTQQTRTSNKKRITHKTIKNSFTNR